MLLSNAKGPWEILEGYLVEDIIRQEGKAWFCVGRMDLELRNFNPAATRRDARLH